MTQTCDALCCSANLKNWFDLKKWFLFFLILSPDSIPDAKKKRLGVCSKLHAFCTKHSKYTHKTSFQCRTTVLGTVRISQFLVCCHLVAATATQSFSESGPRYFEWISEKSACTLRSVLKCSQLVVLLVSARPNLLLATLAHFNPVLVYVWYIFFVFLIVCWQCAF